MFLIEATDRHTGKTVYGRKSRGHLVFAAGYHVGQRTDGSDHYYGYYDRQHGEHFDGPEACELLAVLPEGADMWTINPRIIRANTGV